MKILHDDGHVSYYYYKKKLGRKKKTGRKRKKKTRGRRWQETWDYKIVRCTFNKQDEYIGNYRNLEEVEYARRVLEEENERIVFPVRFVNNGRKSTSLYDFKCEYLILRRGAETTHIQDEYGKYIKHVTNSENWSVYDKFQCLKEETFWVYGFNPRTGRKTFAWIYDNLIEGMTVPTGVIRVYIYNNKVIIQYDDDFNFVICKNTSDAIRFYNLIEKMSKNNNAIVLTGMTLGHTERTNTIFNLIKEKTGWSDAKIYRTTTRS